MYSTLMIQVAVLLFTSLSVVAGAAEPNLEPLPGGKLLRSGGCDEYYGTTREEVLLHDITTGKTEPFSPFKFARCQHQSLGLSNGKIFVYGGIGYYPPSHPSGSIIKKFHSTVEIWDPTFGKWFIGPASSVARYSFKSVLLENGQWVVFGGAQQHNRSVLEAFDTQRLTWSSITPPPFSVETYVAHALKGNRILFFVAQSESALLYSWETDSWERIRLARCAG